MIKPPASFIFDFDEEDTVALSIFTKDYEGKHQYIRRDVVEKMIRVAMERLGIVTFALEPFINQIISEEENKTQNENT